jgi:membrane-bound lytic murein transglycosylase B
MSAVRPDPAGLEALRDQPEFNEQLWQYLNRRVSDWRIITGTAKAKEYAPLFARIERDYGVEPAVMLGVWGVESTFGDPLVQKKLRLLRQ